MDAMIAKGKDRMCVSAAQQAQGIVGDMLSAYWSVIEGKKVPGVFLAQARERIKHVSETLDALEK